MPDSYTPSSGLYKRLFAKGMAHGDRHQDNIYGERKKRLLQRVHGRVLEIGAGTGINLPYLPQDVQWTGIEPNPHMHRYIYEKAADLRLDVEIQTGYAESLSFHDESFDAVISTLVLCSVHDQSRVLDESLRVLKPGGLFVFIEHVAASRGTWLHKFQRFVKPVWKLVADGCRPDRDTECTLLRAGFSTLHVEPFHSSVPLNLIKPHIMGWGIK